MSDSAGTRFERLVDIMHTLRGPHGCPWDREQTLSSLRPFVLEETYELLDALDRQDLTALREELGDFLFEAVFLAHIADEAGHFTIGDAIQAITDKLVRRHPHVFTPDGRPLGAGSDMTAAAVIEKWEVLKAGERRTAGTPEKTILDGVPRTLPALLRAYELSSRAAAVGFDWVQTAEVLDKIDEEVGELKEMVRATPRNARRVEEEMGDLLFSLANLARKLEVEPEAALRVANEKFQRRFEGMERSVMQTGRSLRELTLDELERAWTVQKQIEGANGHDPSR
jgi:MazG family protein